MTSLTSTPAVEALRGRLRDPEVYGEEILCALYGPGWTSAVHSWEFADSQRFRMRRLPKARKAAEFLRPLLVERLAHDGRNDTGRARAGSTGWWLRTDDGSSWTSVALIDVVDVVAALGEDLLTVALQSVGVAEYAVATEEYAASESGRHRAIAGEMVRAAHKNHVRARQVAAALDSLSGLLESGLTTMGAVLTFYRTRPEFRLPEDVFAAQVREWLVDKVVGTVPGVETGGRIRASDLWRLYESSSVAGLPKSRAFDLFDRVLPPGRDYTDPTRAVYTIPEDLV